MTKYRKVYRDHYDPETGLRWFSDDYIPEKRSVMEPPGILMWGLTMAYLVFWTFWLVNVFM